MNLLFDLGNTRLKTARLRDRGLEPGVALAWADAGFESALHAWLTRIGAEATTVSWLAAVAPEPAIERLAAALADAGLSPPRRVRTQADALGLRIAYERADTLGVDRWLALLAARARACEATLVVGVGTALTIDALDADGQHLGGLIAPPPEAMRTALLARAPRLDVPGGAIERFARSTPDAIASGCTLAAAALVERSHAELAQRASATPRLLLAGGGADALRAWIPLHELAPHLVLEGLARWATVALR